MSKSFLDYLSQKEIKSRKIQLKKEDKKIEEIVEKPENVQLNEQLVKIEMFRDFMVNLSPLLLSGVLMLEVPILSDIPNSYLSTSMFGS